MLYLDKVYGETEITEPIILDLMHSCTMERLKGIDQAGYFEPYFPNTKHNRFEHSLGVYILLKNFGASLEEQISGLIHDVSHSAFSHVTDGVLKNSSSEKEDHQDNIFEQFVKNSEIPKILVKYNIDVNYILNDDNFLLKEQKLPELCADRIDYILRDSFCFGVNANPKFFLDNLFVENNKWIFKNFEVAKKFAELFKEMNDDYYSGLVNAVMCQTVGDYLRYSLTKGYIGESDLYTDDNTVLSILNKYHQEDEKLKLFFDGMNNKVGYKNDPNDFDILIRNKSRIVDPLFYKGSEIKRFSELNPSWNVVVNQDLQPKEYFLKFER
jgi:hypothetical protein